MRIRIVERTPAAYVDLGAESVWLIDPSGIVIAEQSAAETETLVVIRDLQPIEPEPGVRTGSEPLLNALEVWAGLSPELQSMTRFVSASSVDKTALVTVDEIEILVGSSEDIGTKDVIAREILTEHGGRGRVRERADGRAAHVAGRGLRRVGWIRPVRSPGGWPRWL